MNTINVMNTDISVAHLNDDDYLSLTDMIRAKDGDFFVADWLRNRNTLEYLGIWEQVYNPNFNYGEFATIKNQAGLNRFKISVKEYAERTGAIWSKNSSDSRRKNRSNLVGRQNVNCQRLTIAFTLMPFNIT